MKSVSPLSSRPGRSIALPYASRIDLANLPGSNLPWLIDGRDAAMTRFAELGLPGQKIEEWKYSNLAPLAKAEFTDPKPPTDEATRDEIKRRFGKEGAAARLVFVNGMMDESLSALDDLPAGVRVIGLADAILQEDDFLKMHLNATLAVDGNALEALNSALMVDGCLVVLEPGAELVLELLFVAAPDGGTPAYHPRISIVAEAESCLSLGEQHASLGRQEYWSNPVNDIRLGKNARMRHYRLQEESRQAWQTSLTKVRAASGASYENFLVATGSRYARNEIEVKLDGKSVSCNLSGAFMLAGEQQIDNWLRVDHLAPNCVSRQTYKGVLDERAHGVFQGKTVVQQDAQKTDGNQLSRALLLSPDAAMDAKPELEIYADDVKCSHGATVGELDDDQMFYLRTRGIDEAASRRLLIAAFLEEHLQTVSDKAAREWLTRPVTDWLAWCESKGSA